MLAVLVVRFLVVVEPVAGFFDEVDFAAVLLLAFDVGLLAVFAGVLLTLADVLLTVFVVGLLDVALLATGFVGVAIASMRGLAFTGGMLARTCRTAVVCCSSVFRNSWWPSLLATK